MSDTRRNSTQISLLKAKYFPDSTFVGPMEVQGHAHSIWEEQWLWQNRHLIKGIVLDMSTPRHYHEFIYQLPSVERVLISNLDHPVVQKGEHSSPVDIVGDFCLAQLPMPKASADTIICNSILEHCTDPLLMVKNLGQIVRPGGYIFFMCPYAYIDGHMEVDYWRFGRDAYLLLARTAGLDVVETGQYGDLGKYYLQEFGWDASATSFHRGIPQCNWMICRRPAEEMVQQIEDNIVQATQPGIKFMQVHTFYQQYLETFYHQYPEYAQLSFSEQINALVRDGFSANHMMAPYLGPQGYEAYLVIANNPHSQFAWIEENNISGVDQNNWGHDVVRRQIESIRPDVLYLSDPISFDSNFVRSLSYRPKLVMGWRAADIPSGIDWSEFDTMLSCLSGLREVAIKLGAKTAEHFFPGFPVWMNTLTESVQPSHDVVFTGSWTPVQHEERNRLLSAVALDSPGKYSCAFYLNAPMKQLPPEVASVNWGACFGVEMYRALRSGRIVLDARARHTYVDRNANISIDMGGSETANMRIFEVTGCGSFLLTEHFDNLKDFFEIGTEIETFRNIDELKEKIRYYLAHPEEREAIARRGQQRCLRDYSMERQAEAFDRIIRRHLMPQSDGSAGPSTGVTELKQRAELSLEAGDVRTAFELLVEAKALKQPQEGLDLLRAHCFLRMNQAMGAIEALREELRWFPGNSVASQLLEKLQALSLGKSCSLGDAEFQHIVATIRPYTMLSDERLFSIYSLAKSVCERNVPGNFVECGVAAGGSSALLAYVIKRYSNQPRRLFSFDSFSGMPAPTEKDTQAGIGADASGWGTGTCAAPEESVREVCSKLGALDVLTPVKGYFEETLPIWRDRVGMISFLHLDGDWYESTKAILSNLYDRISNDGLLQVDDYGHWEGCSKAIHEFEAERGLNFSITQIDGTGVWFPKPDRFPANPGIPRQTVDLFNECDRALQGIQIQMSPNERFQLFFALQNYVAKSPATLRFIEIGSFAGGSFALAYLTLRRMHDQVHGYSVDPGNHPSLKAVVGTISPDATYLPMYSHQAVDQLCREFADGNLPQYIMVDGDHTYEGVRQDILDYYPLLAPGGVIVFHDWLPPLTDENREAILAHHGGIEPGIRRACEEVLEEFHQLQPLSMPLLYPSDPTQTQPQIPIIPGVFSTIRAYRKPMMQD